MDALERFSHLFDGGRAIMAGDLNSNTSVSGHERKHPLFVNAAKSKGLASVYHTYTGARLKRTRQLWLFAEDHLTDAHILRFGDLRDSDLKTARAWALKENFRWFWTYQYAGNARKYFQEWYGWACRSRLPPIIKVAKMLKGRLENLLTYMRHHITNAAAEGFNSKIQAIKSAARGFRSFANYRRRILFYGGKLDVMPAVTSH